MPFSATYGGRHALEAARDQTSYPLSSGTATREIQSGEPFYGSDSATDDDSFGKKKPFQPVVFWHFPSLPKFFRKSGCSKC